PCGVASCTPTIPVSRVTGTANLQQGTLVWFPAELLVVRWRTPVPRLVQSSVRGAGCWPLSWITVSVPGWQPSGLKPTSLGLSAKEGAASPRRGRGRAYWPMASFAITLEPRLSRQKCEAESPPQLRPERHFSGLRRQSEAATALLITLCRGR